ncbi:MAG: magnesium transporter [Pseudomonadota bacterium]
MSAEETQTPEPQSALPSWTRGAPGEVLDENKPLIAKIKSLIKNDKKDAVLATVQGWPPADIMELLVQLPVKSARTLHGWLPVAPAAKVLVEVNPGLRAVLMEESGLTRLAAIVADLEDDVAVELLSDLPDEVVEAVLPHLPRGPALSRRLGYDEHSAGAIMSNRFVAVLEHWQVGTATRQIRREAGEIEKLHEVYVVDGNRRLVGLLKLRDLLLNSKRTIVRQIMRKVPLYVGPDEDRDSLLEQARYYKVQAVPVVDKDRRVIGRITLKEMREAAQESAEEDIKVMGRVSADANPNDSLLKIVKGRLPWLVAGLFGASVAASVVGSFEEDLERAAILASFIPVVMAMAGNAGIQASTVTVQGLADGTLWLGDMGQRLLREFAGSLINGLSVAVLLGILILSAAQFFDIIAPLRLAFAAGLSVATVTTLAATIGATIPLVLNHFKVDPAVATGVFITTSNDIFGVLIYFLIATNLYSGVLEGL